MNFFKYLKIWGGLARQNQASAAPLSNRPETRDFFPAMLGMFA